MTDQSDVTQLIGQAAALLERCKVAGLKLAAAESCTGGLIMACLTEVPGSSAIVDCGFVTYSNEAKSDLLGVPADMIREHGAVSEEVARSMAAGALKHSLADIAVSVTGIAGPDGGTPEKPVGLVHIAAARKDGRVEHKRCLFGDVGRAGIRHRSVAQAFKLIEALIA